MTPLRIMGGAGHARLGERVLPPVQNSSSERGGGGFPPPRRGACAWSAVVWQTAGECGKSARRARGFADDLPCRSDDMFVSSTMESRFSCTAESGVVWISLLSMRCACARI